MYSSPSALALLPVPRCVVTKSSYTENEDFTGADAIFDCIGEAGSERFSLSDLVAMVQAKQGTRV